MSKSRLRHETLAYWFTCIPTTFPYVLNHQHHLMPFRFAPSVSRIAISRCQVQRFRRFLRRYGLPLRLPPGPHSSAVDFLSPEVDLVDPPRVGNVLEWVRVEDDEIGALAGGHHSGLDLRDLGGVARRHDYRLGRCEAHGHETFELHLVVPTEATPGCPVVAAKYELHAGTDELLRNVSRLLCLPTRALDGHRRHCLYRFALLLLDQFARKHLPQQRIVPLLQAQRGQAAVLGEPQRPITFGHPFCDDRE